MFPGGMKAEKQEGGGRGRTHPQKASTVKPSFLAFIFSGKSGTNSFRLSGHPGVAGMGHGVMLGEGVVVLICPIR